MRAAHPSIALTSRNYCDMPPTAACGRDHAIRPSLVGDDPLFMAVTLASVQLVQSLPAERVRAQSRAVVANAPRCRRAGQ